MENTKITRNMKFMDMMTVMSEGNSRALDVLKEMIQYPKLFRLDDIFLLDSLNIRGSKIWTLYSDCCGSSRYKLKRTLMVLKCGVYSEEEIQGNLNLCPAIPFLDDFFDASYDPRFGPNDEKWNKYVKENIQLVAPKIHEKMAEQISYRK